MKEKWIRISAMVVVCLLLALGADTPRTANAGASQVLRRDDASYPSMPPSRPVAGTFTSGNIVVYRVGDGSAALSSAAVAVFLDEYNSTGTLVQSIALPTSVSGSNKQLVAAGSATSEGLLTRSTDGLYLLLTGYAATPGTASIGGTTSSAVNRVVGRVDWNGTIDTTTALNDFASGGSPRSAVSTNGTDIWVSGTGSVSSSGGVRYATLGGTTSVQLNSTLTNLRQVNIFNGQLYISTASGSTVRIGAVGTGTPTTTGQTITNLPSFPTAGSPYGFFFADLSDTVAGVDTLYVADDSAVALTKYSLVGGNWTSNGVIGTSADTYRGITGIANGSTVTLYLTRKGSELVSLVDSSGYNGAFAGAPTLLATAGANTAFRGVALAPTSSSTAVSLSSFTAQTAETPEMSVLAVLGTLLVIGAGAWRMRTYHL